MGGSVFTPIFMGWRLYEKLGRDAHMLLKRACSLEPVLYVPQHSIVGTRRGTIHSLAITSRSWPGPGFNRTFHRKTSRRLEAARLVVYIITSLWNATGANGIFKCISLNEIICILIRISLKFVPTVPIDNKWTLVQVMAWRRTGDKPLSELMLTQFADVYMRH